MSPVYINYVDYGTIFTVIIAVRRNYIGMMISKAKKC